MKTNITNAVIIITLHFAVVACSKLESNDMVFKSAVTSDELSSPTPGDQPDPTKDSTIIVVEDGGTTSAGSTVGSSSAGSTDGSASAGSTDGSASAGSTDGSASAGSTDGSASAGSTDGSASAGSTDGSASAGSTDGSASAGSTSGDSYIPPTTPVPDIVYSEDEIPVCLLDVKFSGAGSAANLSIVSASKDELKNLIFKGFESLSESELEAMRAAVNSLSSSESVQVIKDGSAFEKSAFKKGSKILIVVDGKKALLEIAGFGKDAQVYIMNVSEKHNTVCLQANGMTNSSQLYATVKGDPAYVSRANADVNGSGSVKSFLKVVGGNQTGSYINVNSMKDLELSMITQGKNDTFSSLSGNSIQGGKYSIQVKGLNKTGFGLNAKSVSDGAWDMKIEGEDEVGLLMNVDKMSNNEISGWLKFKSGAKLSPELSGSIELMTIP